MPDNPVRAEILPGWTAADGSRMAAIRLVLAPGWKTYWRAPGDAGIPPVFSWNGSRNLRSVAVHWPAPEVYMTYGMRTIGYENEVVLPIELHPKTPGTPIRVAGRMELGVCEDVCIPASLRFDAELQGEGASSDAIRTALDARPMPSTRAGVRRVTCRMDPTSDGMRLSAEIVMPRLGGEETVLVETANPTVWVAEPQAKRNGGSLHVVAELVPQLGQPLAVERKGLRFTVLGQSNAVDIRGCEAG